MSDVSESSVVRPAGPSGDEGHQARRAALAGRGRREGVLPPGLALLGALLLTIGCAASGPRSAVPAAAGPERNPLAAPSLGAGPPGEGGAEAVERLERLLQRDWSLLAAQGASPAESPPTPGPPTPGVAPRAASPRVAGPLSCVSTCRLSERICEAATKICSIAAELPGEADLGPRCERARDHCRRAADLCSGCGGRPPAVP